MGSTIFQMLFVALLISGVWSLRLTKVEVPDLVKMGDPVWLNCSYDLENDDLYSIKWYHSNNETHSVVEFYRWLPKDNPPGQKYDSRGIYLDLSKSSNGQVYLSKTDRYSEGTFRCEVSAEAPSFQTVRKEKEMRVYALPKDGPLISGVRSEYRPDDLVNVTCEDGPSKPRPTLAWFIDGKPPEDNDLRVIPTAKRGDGLQQAKLQLQFPLQKYFYNGMLKLRCTSIIQQTYTLSSEEIIISDHAKPTQTHSAQETDGPIITGARSYYTIGDLVNLTCISSSSKSVPELKFYINDIEVDKNLLRRYEKQTTSLLRMEFIVDNSHFKPKSRGKPPHTHRQLRVKCTATMSKEISRNSREARISGQAKPWPVTFGNGVFMNRGNGFLYSILSVLSAQILIYFIRSFNTLLWLSTS